MIDPTLLLTCLLAAGSPLPVQHETAAETSLSGEVFTILVARCIECHGRDKRQGELRLDIPEGVQTGGESGPVVVADDPPSSDLLRRVTLPVGDEDLMPPADEGEPLTTDQVELIRRWIESGADLTGWEPFPAPPRRPMAELLAELGAGVRAAPNGALAPIEAVGGRAQPIHRHTTLLQVNLSLAGAAADDSVTRRLYPLRRHITWLDLSGTAVTDAGLDVIARLPRLTRLHLERTAIGDQGLAHLQDLEHLEYLNLYATRVSDAGLEHLRRLGSLRRLYLWQTAVTESGAARLREALPQLEINLGAPTVAERSE